MADQQVEFALDLIRKYDKSGPRYTSYPTAPQFHEDFGPEAYEEVARATNAEAPKRPLSLYFHIPFCDTLCFYCACNKIATKDRSKAVTYLDYLFKEIELQGALFDGDRPVDQLHWGGGTPTFLNPDQMRALMAKTAEHFRLRDDDSGEYGIEVDPRAADSATIAALREVGFNRLSVGVQDFDPKVQEAVNRIQPAEQTFAVIDAARREGFHSLSLDLMYGLPFQSRKTFAHTLERVLEARPDRLAVFNYAHLPDLFPPQRRIRDEDLPAPEEKLEILQYTIERLTAAGYVYIGMDHFALPDDELTRAQQQGQLHRNFQGYSTHADCDLVAMGVTAIGSVGATYSQNVRTLEPYYAALEAGELPVFRGYELTGEDRLRRAVITRLMCDFALDFDRVEADWGVDFREHFAAELADLAEMAADGLIELMERGLTVTPRGRLLIRNIAMVFDAYLRAKEGAQRYSKVI
ncbi:coproporphyrinogen III oxidase [Thiohalorhabdus denitrificans]|uniref:Coproporphyrinogen-III oxidase n=1 Tax=Thiohalorhabdus denitrificans TaxID=381306 RepID=A0A0P9CQC2_9GAMM|nr:oxygen-independent coproporphyrinogen III oxidase [Thiohalorhabdus denitrificans]KPV41386.1 coproporphyrinogen III oxidase [Thiohalorhabdus denitrificans]SCY25488.1 oxygen-independent coproporphyrinogen-3 oxidase [Thiohalorhabdus denitrificans]